MSQNHTITPASNATRSSSPTACASEATLTGSGAQQDAGQPMTSRRLRFPSPLVGRKRLEVTWDELEEQ
jgi:hypothetical protein